MWIWFTCCVNPICKVKSALKVWESASILWHQFLVVSSEISKFTKLYRYSHAFNYRSRSSRHLEDAESSSLLSNANFLGKSFTSIFTEYNPDEKSST